MKSSAKPYRIELLNSPEIEQPTEAIITRLEEIRQLLLSSSDAIVEDIKIMTPEIREAARMKAELDAISYVIEKTKKEVATLHFTGANGRELARTSDELGAIVAGTEVATNTILNAAEVIDDAAGNLLARLTGDDAAIARDIADQVVRIFEACNFQDITGQRIAKVLASMRFIEDRVNRMVEIWGGLSALGNVDIDPDPNRTGERALLNGPALTSLDATTQAEIDALFD